MLLLIFVGALPLLAEHFFGFVFDRQHLFKLFLACLDGGLVQSGQFLVFFVFGLGLALFGLLVGPVEQAEDGMSGLFFSFAF